MSVHVRTDVGGTLSEPWPLCQWCYRYVRDLGALPEVTEVELHHADGKRRRAT